MSSWEEFGDTEYLHEWREWARRALKAFGQPVPVLDQQLQMDLDALLDRLLTCERCGRVGDELLCSGCDHAIVVGKGPQTCTQSDDTEDLATRLFIAALMEEEDWNNGWTDTAVLNALRRVRHILSIVTKAGGIRGTGGGIDATCHSKRRWNSDKG